MADVDGVGAAGGTDEEKFGTSKRALTLWDLSQQPITNDREAKLSAQDFTKAQAYNEYDVETRLAKLSEALADPPGTRNRTERETPMSQRVFNPDNWVPRFLSEFGKDAISVWDLRLSADHTNLSSGRRHLSTMVVDQSDTQFWAFDQDLFWIAETCAPVTDPELEFTGASFLAQLYKDETAGFKVRGALALNMSIRGGFVADRTRFAQLFHVLTMAPAGLPTATISGCTDGGERPTLPTELFIRGDAQHVWENGTGRFFPFLPPDGNEDAELLDEGDLFEVVMFVDPLIRLPPITSLDSSDDPSSNQIPIQKDEQSPVRYVVRIPNSAPPQFDASFHGCPPANLYYGSGIQSTTVGQPVPTPGGGGTPTGNGSNTDGSDNVETPGGAGGDNFNPDVNQVITGTQQVQYGFAEPNSPGFTQRFNVFKSLENLNPVESYMLQSRPESSVLRIELQMKASAPIPSGQTVNMHLTIGEFRDDKPPQILATRRIPLDSTTPAGEDAEWRRYLAEFKGLQPESRNVIVILERRNNEKPQPKAEIWQVSMKPSKQ